MTYPVLIFVCVWVTSDNKEALLFQPFNMHGGRGGPSSFAQRSSLCCPQDTGTDHPSVPSILVQFLARTVQLRNCTQARTSESSNKKAQRVEAFVGVAPSKELCKCVCVSPPKFQGHLE